MSRSLQAAAIVLIAGCASNPNPVVSPRCDLFDDCFDRGRVRSYEFLDQDTLIVEVGPNRCPFLLEVDGFDCNLAFAGRLAFYDNDRRICALDNAVLATSIFVGSYPQGVCYIRDVRAISEDELLERYATSGRIPPLPPAGSGELQVEEGAAAATPAPESADKSTEEESTVETDETS